MAGLSGGTFRHPVASGAYRKGLARICNIRTQQPRHRLNRKPRWPAHGHRGFLVQRNHESGGIVIWT